MMGRWNYSFLARLTIDCRYSRMDHRFYFLYVTWFILYDTAQHSDRDSVLPSLSQGAPWHSPSWLEVIFPQPFPGHAQPRLFPLQTPTTRWDHSSSIPTARPLHLTSFPFHCFSALQNVRFRFMANAVFPQMSMSQSQMKVQERQSDQEHCPVRTRATDTGIDEGGLAAPPHSTCWTPARTSHTGLLIHWAFKI